jgi:uncharacterized protein YndB with AHSA1/START domain
MSTNDRLEREVLIDAPIERVWALITESEHFGSWFADSGAEIDLRPGGAMKLSWEEHGTVLARVERVEPPNLFAYRWANATDTEPSEGHSTLVEFSLAPEEDGTRVRVVESGFAGLDTSDAERRRQLDDNTEGWAIELGDLTEYATKSVA